MMIKRIKPFYIQNRFFYAALGIIVLFVISFVFPIWFNIVKLLVLAILTLTFLDIVILFFTKRGINAKRTLSEKFSNGDQNPVQLSIENYYTFPIFIQVIDLTYQLDLTGPPGLVEEGLQQNEQFEG